MLSNKKLLYKIVNALNDLINALPPITTSLNEVVSALSPTQVGTATRTSVATTGTIAYVKFFKIVLVQISDLSVSTNTHATVLATGLPTRNSYIPIAVLNTVGDSTGWRVAVDSSGRLVNHYPTSGTVNQCSGTFWYIAD